MNGWRDRKIFFQHIELIRLATTAVLEHSDSRNGYCTIGCELTKYPHSLLQRLTSGFSSASKGHFLVGRMNSNQQKGPVT